MSLVIAMNGNVACLKTTIARKLARNMRIDLIETHVFGNVIGKNKSKLSSLELRNLRYKKLFSSLELYLEKGKDVILDGTFCRRAWRKQLYSLIRTYGAELYFIRCVCSDEEIIKQRLNKRKQMIGCPEHHCNKFSDYLHDKRIEENIYYDNAYFSLGTEIIKIDTANLVIMNKRNVPFLRQLEKSLKEIVPDKKYLAGLM